MTKSLTNFLAGPAMMLFAASGLVAALAEMASLVVKYRHLFDSFAGAGGF